MVRIPPQILRQWLPLALISSFVFATLYLSLQHHIRTSADAPQVQLAQDTARQLFLNKAPSVSLPGSETEIDKSLAPFVILYNSNGQAVEGTGKIDGKLPTPPKGVFEYAAKHTEHRLTWQPRDDTRVAAVVRYYQNSERAGYVLAGRNLREAEREQSQLLLMISVLWLTTLLSSLGVLALTTKR